MDRKRKPGIYLLTDTGETVELILVWLDGQEMHLHGQSPTCLLYTSDAADD